MSNGDTLPQAKAKACSGNKGCCLVGMWLASGFSAECRLDPVAALMVDYRAGVFENGEMIASVMMTFGRDLAV